MLLYIEYGILFVNTVNTKIKACSPLNAMFVKTVDTLVFVALMQCSYTSQCNWMSMNVGFPCYIANITWLVGQYTKIFALIQMYIANIFVYCPSTNHVIFSILLLFKSKMTSWLGGQYHRAIYKNIARKNLCEKISKTPHITLISNKRSKDQFTPSVCINTATILQ